MGGSGADSSALLTRWRKRAWA